MTYKKKKHPGITPYDHGGRYWTDTPKSQATLTTTSNKHKLERGREGPPSRAFRESVAQPTP